MMERKELLMVVMIGALLLTTAVQTVALAGLSSGQVVVTAKTAASGGNSPSSVAPSAGSAGSLENLPSMVGSC